MNASTQEVLKQHLIDPEICIRCNTCEETCPIDAVTHELKSPVAAIRGAGELLQDAARQSFHFLC